MTHRDFAALLLIPWLATILAFRGVPALCRLCASGSTRLYRRVRN